MNTKKLMNINFMIYFIIILFKVMLIIINNSINNQLMKY